MPPWRTADETRPASSPVSRATIANASSADLRCCASKSGGTYSASITGVNGMILISRMVPPDCSTIITAVAIAGLASSGSVRSTGTSICLYMAAILSQQDSEPLQGCSCDHGTFARRCEPGRRSHQRLIPCRNEQAWGDKRREAPAAGGELAPIVVGKIDHDDASRRQSFVESMRPAREQVSCHIIQAWIMADHQQGGYGPIRGLDRGQDGLAAAFIKTILVVDP